MAAEWRAGERGDFLSAQPDGGQELLTARGVRRRGPDDGPRPGTEAPGAMWPWPLPPPGILQHKRRVVCCRLE